MFRQHCSRGGGRSVETADEVRALLRRWHEHGDGAARAELAERMLPLARSLARRYAGKGEPLDDLEQVASLGLLKAIDRFDSRATSASRRSPSRRSPARSSATSATAAGCSASPARSRSSARASSAPARRSPASSAARRPSTRSRGALGAGVEQVLEALRAADAYRMMSLDEPLADGAGALEAIGGDDAGFELAEHRVMLRRGLDGLGAREREILRLRFYEGLTQREIAAPSACRRCTCRGSSAARSTRCATRSTRLRRTRLEQIAARGDTATRHGRPQNAPSARRTAREEEQERLNRQMTELLNELRVAMPGVQVLFGFLLAVPFQQRFQQVNDFQRDRLPRRRCSRRRRRRPSSSRRRATTASCSSSTRRRTSSSWARASSSCGLAALAVAMNGAVLLVTDVALRRRHGRGRGHRAWRRSTSDALVRPRHRQRMRR